MSVTRSKWSWRRVTVLALAAGLAIASGIFLDSPRPPRWNGKSLRYWFNHLDVHDNTPEQRQEAVEAFQKVGTNAVPWLINELRAKEPPKALRIPIEVLSERTAVRHERAILAFQALGPCAKQAVPLLAELLLGDDPRTSYNAGVVLSRMGSEGASAIMRALNYTNATVRYGLVNLLYQMGPQAVVAATNLLLQVKDPDPTIAYHAARALTQIGADPRFAIPLLTKNLNDTSAICRGASASGLGAFSNLAHVAVPSLMKLLQDPDEDVRDAASNALRKITSGGNPSVDNR